MMSGGFASWQEEDNGRKHPPLISAFCKHKIRLAPTLLPNKKGLQEA